MQPLAGDFLLGEAGVFDSKLDKICSFPFAKKSAYSFNFAWFGSGLRSFDLLEGLPLVRWSKWSLKPLETASGELLLGEPSYVSDTSDTSDSFEAVYSLSST